MQPETERPIHLQSLPAGSESPGQRRLRHAQQGRAWTRWAAGWAGAALAGAGRSIACRRSEYGDLWKARLRGRGQRADPDAGSPGYGLPGRHRCRPAHALRGREAARPGRMRHERRAAGRDVRRCGPCSRPVLRTLKRLPSCSTAKRKSARRSPNRCTWPRWRRQTPRWSWKRRGRTATSSARAKGSGSYRLHVTGHSAHAGVEPEKGINAVVELSHRILALQALNGIAPGVTVNATSIDGGTAIQCHPGRAWVDLDVRAVDQDGARDRPPGAAGPGRPGRPPSPARRSVWKAAFRFPPMERTPAVAFLAGLALEAAQTQGIRVGEAATGGASDACAIGAPACPSWTGWARSAGWTTARTSTSCPPASCPASPCWPG